MKRKRIRRFNGGFVSYELPGVFPGRELEPPNYMTEDDAKEHGWIVERFDGHTRPSKKYPSGQCRWLSEPARPVHRDGAIAEVTRRKKEHRQQWEEDGTKGVYNAPTYRIRNLHTADLVMGAIL